nr:hypothetical protein [Tanacetum cinerariifolium]
MPEVLWSEIKPTMVAQGHRQEEGIDYDEPWGFFVRAGEGGRDEGESWVSGGVGWKVGRVVLRGMVGKPVLDKQCMLFKRDGR